MAAFDTTQPTAGGFNPRGFFLSFFQAASAWNNKRLTRNALRKLSDRELSDIGLSRGDIDNI